MCKCRNLLLPMLTIVVGVLLLASNYGYSDGYYVQAWWPILFVIVGASKLAKQFCCNNKSTCNSEESKNSAKCG
jgi:hypothetical protein